MYSIWISPARCVPTVLSGVIVCFLAVPAAGREPKAPGLHDLVVYEPGIHERGLPAVRFETAADGAGLEVEIPPAVHVHRYYYSGDKEIQGPIIQGGPTVVVARHPKTGEQMYVDVVLPAGTPAIAYNKHSIAYVYPERRVSIHFSKFPFSTDRVIVRYHCGQGVGRTVRDVRERVTERARQYASESPLVQSVRETTGDAAELVRGVREGAGTLTSQVLDGAKSAIGGLPGVSTLRGLAEDSPQQRYLSSVRGAAEREARAATDFVPTLR